MALYFGDCSIIDVFELLIKKLGTLGMSYKLIPDIGMLCSKRIK
jgi:hypothetical protein